MHFSVLQLLSRIAQFLEFQNLGCYQDNIPRAIPTLKTTDPILDGPYSTRANPIAKCAVAAMRRGYSMIAVQHGGWCASSAKAPNTFNKYGTSKACLAGGEGGSMANQVYDIGGKTMDSR